MNDNTLLQTAKEIITAWESLPGNQRYTAREIEKWLIDKMKPAIDKLRSEVLQYE